MDVFIFTKEDPQVIVKNEKRIVLNFENMHSLYLFKNIKLFRKLIQEPQNINFPDGYPLSKYLRIPQKRGPSFTKTILSSDFVREKKHYFIGNIDSDKLSKESGISKKKIRTYNPPFIKESIQFSDKERNKMINNLKKFKPDIVWVCIGNPKQEILANQLYYKYKSVYLCVGAATDFYLGKKKESPRLIRKLGFESIYRLFTDFSHTKKKLWRSIVALRYLKYTTVSKR